MALRVVPYMAHVNSDELLGFYLDFSSGKEHEILFDFNFDFKLEKFLSFLEIIFTLVVLFSVYFIEHVPCHLVFFRCKCH